MSTRGFLLGKFMPPHAGHVFLCNFARAHCDELTILVCSLETEPIPGGRRLEWMKALFPDCRVVTFTEDVPQDPADHPDFWSIWRDIVRRVHPEPIDFVYASEPYGHRLAAEVGARFIPVDPVREAIPVSAAKIRAAPFEHWRFIPEAVRPWFVKRVCLFGPESTGKTTLARWLAGRFGTVHVPEYGRVHTEAFGVNCTPDDLELSARGQLAATTALSQRANRILIEDTDAILTAVWADMLTSSRSAWFDRLDVGADLYLLTAIDIPWVDDGTRYFPGAGDRGVFFARCETELRRRNLPFVLLAGDEASRRAAAEAAILRYFPELASDQK